jgi:signal transduction histidine kinase
MARQQIHYLAFFLLFPAVAIRALLAPTSASQWDVASLLLAFFLLWVSQPWLTRRLEWYPHLYLASQTGVILSLSLSRPELDYMAMLYAVLSLESMSFFSQRTAFLWIGGFSLVFAATLINAFGWADGLPFVSNYVAACLFVALYALANQRAEAARRKSQSLLAELQVAHRNLQAYAAQAEELAAAEERNRLARELHDSVTQTVFSITLTARSAHILLEREPGRSAEQLDRVHELAQDALSELRALIKQLRPRTVAEQGLVPALRRHVAERQARDGLTVDLRVEEERRLPPQTEEALFRVVQEALNNVVKHAQTDRAEVTLCLGQEPVSLLIEDRGVGFDPGRVDSGAEHLGLISMHERVEGLGGRLEIESRPQGGTRVSVQVPLAKKEAHG